MLEDYNTTFIIMLNSHVHDSMFNDAKDEVCD